MFPVTNIIQTSYHNSNVTQMPECQKEHISQILNFQVITPLDYGVDTEWQPKRPTTAVNEIVSSYWECQPHFSGHSKLIKALGFCTTLPAVLEWSEKQINHYIPVQMWGEQINLTGALTQFFQTKGRGSKWWCIGWQFLIWSIMFQLVIICVTHLTSLYLSHLSLGVVEKILVQLSICKSYDNTGSAITWRQKEFRHPVLQFHTLILSLGANKHAVLLRLLSYCSNAKSKLYSLIWRN